MRAMAAMACLALLLACGGDAPGGTAEPLEVRTIESTPIRNAAVQPPPTIEDPALPQRGTMPPPTSTSNEPTKADELKAKTNLPFTPAIAMDPVDGSKVSITAETPVVSYEDKWYYFGSEENRREFLRNPVEHAKCRLARY